MINANASIRPKTFEVGQICFCDAGCTIKFPKFYKVTRLSKSSIWLQRIESHLIEHDGYGQRGREIPVDQPNGSVFRKVRKSFEDGREYVSDRNGYIIEPWDGLAKIFDICD